MHICVVSPSYPTRKTIDFVFVDQLCRAFADNGHKVTIIAPQSLTKCVIRGIPISKYHSYLKTVKGNTIELYRPFYISVGASFLKKIFKNSSEKAIKRAFNSLKDKPDVCYGHFWSSIYSLYPLAKELNIPLFGASGEEDVKYYVKQTPDYIKNVHDYLSGVISVSSKNQQECLELHLVPKEYSVVIPNAINLSLFKKHEKKVLRQKYGIREDAFIVAFTGQFVPRKGTMRLSDALSKLNDENIKAIFMGRGSEDPNYKYIIHKGAVDHNVLPEYLALSDVFVLPTENEGCSNAIIEAMACGLPVISTNAPFNYDILNSVNSIMIDCHDIDQIANAIKTLKQDVGLRNNMANAAYKTAQDLSIEKRAERIVNFMNSKIIK